ncbi:MAG: alpha/beta fold hydrolase [Rubrivivax sp.]
MNAPSTTTAAGAAGCTVYQPRRQPKAHSLTLRGLTYHLQTWLPADVSMQPLPLLVMVHGWADVGASFQFAVDALADLEGPVRAVVAPDWRGFGRSQSSGSDAYWFADYLGDLDALIDHLSPDAPVDLLGHSMGGNVVMSYAGARPQRVRHLINLEGFGLPRMKPEHAPKKLAEWLDDLKKPQSFKPFANAAAVAARLQANNPRLPADKAAWLATHWAAPSSTDPEGPWQLLCDPAHRRVNPVPYRVDETLATWAAITAPLLWVDGAQTDMSQWWGQRYSLAEFHERLNVVADVQRKTLAGCGHMLHHDDPQGLAALLKTFLDA